MSFLFVLLETLHREAEPFTSMCEPVSPWRVSFSGYMLLGSLAEPSRAAKRGTFSTGEQTAAGLWDRKGESRLARIFRFSRITVK